MKKSIFKKFACFLTQQLPYTWMGGKRALRQMIRIFQNKGVSLYETGIVNWSDAEKLERLIESLPHFLI